MRKLIVFIEVDCKRIELDESNLVTCDSYLFVKTATV